MLNSGTTEGINMVAYGWAMPRLEAGDEIVLSSWSTTPISCPGISCANVRVGAEMGRCGRTGALDPQAVIDAIGPKTKLVAVTQCSNVLGTRGGRKDHHKRKPMQKACPVLVDGSQGCGAHACRRAGHRL